MKRIISFGKIDFNGCGRKINEVDVEVEYEDGRFTVSGDIWNARGTYPEIFGQCLDEIKQFLPNDLLFSRIYRLWKLYHLNDMHAGTPKQEEAVDRWLQETGQRYDYEKACEYLKSIGLYSVPAFFAEPYRKNAENMLKPYRYGSEWLMWPIPAEDIQEIKDIIEGRR